MPFTSDASPERMRLKPRTGFARNAAASRPKRPLPRLVLSRISDEMRCASSPRAMPPKPVEIMSLNDIGCVSPQHSQTKAPTSDIADEPQKPMPLARAAL